MTAKQDNKATIRQDKDPHIYAGQGNSRGGRVFKEQTRVRDMPPPTSLWLGVSQKHQVNSHNVSAENLMQTQAGPMLVASIFLSPWKPRLVDLMAHVLFVFFMCFDNYNPFSSFVCLSVGFLVRIPHISRGGTE